MGAVEPEAVSDDEDGVMHLRHCWSSIGICRKHSAEDRPKGTILPALQRKKPMKEPGAVCIPGFQISITR